MHLLSVVLHKCKPEAVLLAFQGKQVIFHMLPCIMSVLTAALS
jgi:hypothetical protein